MKWTSCAIGFMTILTAVNCWTIYPQDVTPKKVTSPYLDIFFCPIREEPWGCAREQSARILDGWETELHNRWQNLKVEADKELNVTLERRGYSASEMPTKEKPSTILKKIEIGTNFMKKYLAETMDGFLGREYEDIQREPNRMQQKDIEDNDVEDDADDNDDEDGDYEDDNNNNGEADVDYEIEVDSDDDDAENNIADEVDDGANDGGEDDDDINGSAESANSNIELNNETHAVDGFANNSEDDEFIEISANKKDVKHKRPFEDNRKNKNKNKKRRKKGQKGKPEVTQPTTLLLVQQAPPPPSLTHEVDGIQLHSGSLGTPGGDIGGGHKVGGKRKKLKKRKKKHGQSGSTVVIGDAPNHIGLELLEELVDGVTDVGGKRKRKQKFPTKYGRSNGVTRGKKKRKKRRAIMKLLILGSFLKAKIELLLKILGAHLQIKFLGIAFLGLLINIARFWIDVKRGSPPQKVVYVEHAHHQHHYEDHGDDWSEGGGGGYWKRSLLTDSPSIEEKADTGYTDSYHPQSNGYDAHYMAYRNPWQ